LPVSKLLALKGHHKYLKHVVQNLEKILLIAHLYRGLKIAKVQHSEAVAATIHVIL